MASVARLFINKTVFNDMVSKEELRSTVMIGSAYAKRQLNLLHVVLEKAVAQEANYRTNSK